MIICGIEEAGRGPVIGPLVMCGAKINKKDEKKLKEIGVKDSKLITPKNREIIFDKLKKIVDYKIIILSPQDVDDALNDEKINLNWLEALTSVKLIDSLDPDQAILDCPSQNINAYREYVKSRLKVECEIIAEHKADLNHLIVGAASILAKVTRDREIEKLKEEIGKDFGSGYPSDPKTKEFLAKYYDKYDIFRKTWKSYTKIIDSKKQKSLSDW